MSTRKKNLKDLRSSAIVTEPIYIDESSRVIIGDTFLKTSVLRRTLGIPIIYLAIFTMPFVLLSSYITYVHLLLLGAKNLKKFHDFIPCQSSFRYNLMTQIKAEKGYWYTWWVAWRPFWYFNCNFYCPYSVALIRWHIYLVKIVENFWCPFHHKMKSNYADGPIDKSFWHLYEIDRAKLHVEDKENKIWNKDGKL